MFYHALLPLGLTVGLILGLSPPGSTALSAICFGAESGEQLCTGCWGWDVTCPCHEQSCCIFLTKEQCTQQLLSKQPWLYCCHNKCHSHHPGAQPEECCPPSAPKAEKQMQALLTALQARLGKVRWPWIINTAFQQSRGKQAHTVCRYRARLWWPLGHAQATRGSLEVAKLASDIWGCLNIEGLIWTLVICWRILADLCNSSM